MADVTTARGTGNIPANIIKPSVASMVAELEPESAPLTVLTNRLNSTATHNPKFSWWEEELETRTAAVEGAVTNVAPTVNVEAGQGSRFAKNNLVLNTATGEIFRVTNVVTDALTVVRGVGNGGTGIAMTDADELLVIGIAMEEGADWAAARSKNPVEKTNYCQIFETPYESTDTLLSTDQWTRPHDFDRKARIAGIEHAKDHEYAAWFGKDDLNTSGTHPRRTSAGFFDFVSTNNSDTGGATTEAEFFQGLSGMFRYGSKEKWGFGARIPVDVLNSFPRGKLQIQQGEKTYGLRVMRYVSPHGDLNLVTHWLFGDTSKYNKYIAIVDLGNAGKRYLSNENGSRDTHTVPTPKTGDRTKKVILTECGFEYKLEKTHGFFSNITS